jgi:hypothetical protein
VSITPRSIVRSMRRSCVFHAKPAPASRRKLPPHSRGVEPTATRGLSQRYAALDGPRRCPCGGRPGESTGRRAPRPSALGRRAPQRWLHGAAPSGPAPVGWQKSVEYAGDAGVSENSWLLKVENVPVSQIPSTNAQSTLAWILPKQSTTNITSSIHN